MKKNFLYSNYFLLVCLLFLVTQILLGLHSNYKRFKFPFVEFPFIYSENNIDNSNSNLKVTSSSQDKQKSKPSSFSLKQVLLSPWRIIHYSSIFGFNHSFARGTYQITTDGASGNLELIRVFTDEGTVPPNSDRSGFLKPLTLHVVYGSLGIIYFKVTKEKSFVSLTDVEFETLQKLFHFSGIRYLNKTKRKPETSLLKIRSIKIPTHFVGQFNGVSVNDTLVISYDHETGDMNLVQCPSYEHNFNKIDIEYFLDEKIRFHLD